MRAALHIQNREFNFFDLKFVLLVLPFASRLIDIFSMSDVVANEANDLNKTKK